MPVGDQLIRSQSPDLVTFLTLVINLAESTLLSQPSQKASHHLRLFLLALMHCANTRFALRSGEIEDATIAIEGVLALQIDLASIFEGQLFCFEAFILEEHFSVRIRRKGWQSFGLDDAFGEGNGRTP